MLEILVLVVVENFNFLFFSLVRLICFVRVYFFEMNLIKFVIKKFGLFWGLLCDFLFYCWFLFCSVCCLIFENSLFSFIFVCGGIFSLLLVIVLWIEVGNFDFLSEGSIYLMFVF